MSDPVKSGMFNGGVFWPVVEILLLVGVGIAAGWYYYDTRGIPQVEASASEVVEAEESYELEIKDHEQFILDALDQQQATKQEREEKIAQAALIDNQIKVEHERIQDGRLRDRDLTDQFVALRKDIERADDQHRAKQTELLERNDELRQVSEDLAVLQSEAADSLDSRNSIDADIAALRRERERDPLSIFPPGAGLAAIVELEDGDQIFGVSLSGVIRQFGSINVGLSGNVALANATNSSVKEGGVFVNIPVVFRRASIDLETGLASLTNPSGSDDMSGFLAATFRYAPIRKERFFLLGGLKYRESDPSLRLGVGFGRR